MAGKVSEFATTAKIGLTLLLYTYCTVQAPRSFDQPAAFCSCIF
jgi:hypothetical protein